jgi:hypothetical protein
MAQALPAITRSMTSAMASSTVGKRRIRGDLFEHTPLARSDGIAALAFRGVANTNDVAVAAVQARGTHRDLHGHGSAVLGRAPSLMGREIDVRIVHGGRAAIEKI